MRLKIPKISHDETISAFIKGLRFHEALRNKLLRKRPTTWPSSSPRLKITPTPTTQKNLFEMMREVPTSLPGEMIIAVVSTTGATAVPTTVITGKVGIGGATIVTILEESAPATMTTK